MMMIPMMIKCDVCVHVYVYTTVLHGVALSCCANAKLFFLPSLSLRAAGAAFSSLFCLFSFLEKAVTYLSFSSLLKRTPLGGGRKKTFQSIRGRA